MAAMQIKLADFEGPLDLLLHLIEKNKIDIYDIPIVSVTEQYIQYLDAMETYDWKLPVTFWYWRRCCSKSKAGCFCLRSR